MPIPIQLERYECSHCGKQYRTVDEASKCEVDHDLVYIAIMRSDLRALWSFLATGNPAYITSTLEQTLRKYNKILGKA